MRLQVRKCPFTGKIFEEKDIGKYTWHLKVLRDEQRTERAHERHRAEFASWLNIERAKELQISDVIPWFLKNQKHIMEATNAITFSGSYDKKYSRGFVTATDNFKDLKFSHLKYSDTISNTHHFPDNGVTNWGRKEDHGIMGYPGWRGDMSGSLARAPRNMYGYPTSEALNLVGLKTGSGGGGNERWNYEVYIFLADWPGLQHELNLQEQDLVADILKGKK